MNHDFKVGERLIQKYFLFPCESPEVIVTRIEGNRIWHYHEDDKSKMENDSYCGAFIRPTPANKSVTNRSSYPNRLNLSDRLDRITRKKLNSDEISGLVKFIQNNYRRRRRGGQ